MRPGDAVVVVTTGNGTTTLPRFSSIRSSIGTAAANIAPGPGHRPGVLDAGSCGRSNPASSILPDPFRFAAGGGRAARFPGKGNRPFSFPRELRAKNCGCQWRVEGTASLCQSLRCRYQQRGSAWSCSGIVVISNRLRGRSDGRVVCFAACALAEISAATSGSAFTGTGYYLIGYRNPSGQNANRARFRAISVQLKRPRAGLCLSRQPV